MRPDGRGELTLAKLVRQFDVHPNQITAWEAEVLEGAAEIFGASRTGSAPGIVLKTFHAKTAELMLQNDCLSAALGKAGPPSAKR